MIDSWPIPILFAKIIPEDKSGEFFGFYNTFGRAGSVIGPLLVNVFLVAFNNIRIALIPLIVLFILGALFLKFVKEQWKFLVKNQLFSIAFLGL